MRTEPYISYFLPKSVLLPSLRRRGPRRVYDLVQVWLAERLVYRFDPKVSLSLTIPLTDQTAKERLMTLDQEFGAHRISGGEMTWPDEIEISQFWEWRLSHEQISNLFDMVESSLVPFATYRYMIAVSADFLLLDANGHVLSGQGFEEPDCFHSNLLLRLSDNSCVAPDIRFPFERDGDEFRKVWEAFKTTAPFHLNDKYLRLARCKNDRVIVRKLQR